MNIPPETRPAAQEPSPGQECLVHGSCVSLQGRAVLLLGPSGSGKSSLALQLMAYGADLVADDMTHVQLREGALLAGPPKKTAGLVEARGVGLLSAGYQRAVIRLVIDLSGTETDRLPPERRYNLLGQSVPLLHKVEAAFFPAAILQYLKGGRSA